MQAPYKHQQTLPAMPAMSTCGPDHLDFSNQSSAPVLAATGVAVASAYGFLLWGSYRAYNRLLPWPLLLPTLCGAAAVALYAWNIPAYHDPITFVGSNPPSGSVLHLPVLEVGCSPAELGDDYIEDEKLHYLCKKEGSWAWNGATYQLRCVGEEQDSSAPEDEGGTGSATGNFKERGNSRFPVRMGMTIKFDEKIKLGGHHFKDKKYKITGARLDALHVRDPLLQELWHGMTNTKDSGTGIACTNVHMFMKTDYMGIYTVCSDRDDSSAVAGEADWIVETVKEGMEIERAPKGDDGEELCEDQGVQPYPEAPLCEPVRKYMQRVEADPHAVANYADQFIIGEIMRDADGYRGSTFVHVRGDSVFFGPQWDCDRCFKFHNQGYKGWYYKVNHWPTARMTWADDPRPKAAEIKARYLKLRAEGGALSNAAVTATFDKISAGMHEDAHFDETVWTRPDQNVRDVGTPHSLAMLGKRTVGSFAGEFSRLKQLTLSRLCWIEQHIDELQDRSGQPVEYVEGWGFYFAALSWPAAGLAFLVLLAHAGRALFDWHQSQASEMSEEVIQSLMMWPL